MSVIDGIRKTKLPHPKQILDIPNQIKTTAQNIKTNQINVRYFDRFFKKCIKIKGTISHNTSIPIVYFETPQKLAGLIFDDSTYVDEENNQWVDFCEDYSYAINYNTELIQFLNIQYYNDFADLKINQNMGDEKYKSYIIPVLLNKIPREIIKIDIRQRFKLINDNYTKNKIEITQNLIRQLGDIIMLSRTGKKDNSFIITGVLLGGSLGMILGIIFTLAFISK